MEIRFFKNENALQFFDEEQQFFFQATLKLMEVKPLRPASTPNPAGIEMIEKSQTILRPVFKIHEEFIKEIDQFTKDRYRYYFSEALFDVIQEKNILVLWKNRNIDIKYDENEVLILSDCRGNPIMNANMTLLPTFDQLMAVES